LDLSQTVIEEERGSMDLGQSDLRAKIRKLMASGVLPGEPPSIERPVERLPNRRIRILIGERLREPLQSATTRVRR
jgi:hypothetical protein